MLSSKGFTWAMPSWQLVKESLETLELVLEGKEVPREDAVRSARAVSDFSAYIWRALFLVGSERRVVHNGS